MEDETREQGNCETEAKQVTQTDASKKEIRAWIREHKKALTRAGICVAGLIALVAAWKNRESLQELFAQLKQAVGKQEAEVAPLHDTGELHAAQLKQAVEKPEAAIASLDNASELCVGTDHPAAHRNSPQKPFDVREHIRNLPEGCHASPEKIHDAEARGIPLRDGQTVVCGYTKGTTAAEPLAA